MGIASWDTGCGQISAQSWFEKGEAAFCEDKHTEAADCFEQVLKTDPFNARAHTRLSNVYWAQGRVEDTLNSLTRALELEPGDRDTVLACTRVFAALEKEDFAKEVLQSYLDKNPQDKEIRSRLDSLAKPADQVHHSHDAAEFFNRQGEYQFERGNAAHAEACFEMAIEQNPLMAMAYNNLGVINFEKGNITKALENLFKAHELKPEDTEILRNSARGLAKAGQFDAAIDVYREYLRRSPEDSKAWLEFESLIRQTASPGWNPGGLSNEVADIYLQTAEMLGKAGDLKGATEAISRAMKIKPPAPDSLCVLASLHCAMGQQDEAEGILNQALIIDPSHGPCSAMLKSLGNGNKTN
ncbi:MAG: tetratricopeptide repeat protein [Syntrophobacteraceae bacterium]|jgi:tetratricopeptide (TPR) repeat protein